MDESLFTKVPVKVQKKSGFDLSFQNLLTTKVGTITPVVCEELMPNETIHLRAAIQAQLPPLASDTFMRCDLKYEAFFVPHRLCMKGFEEWLVPGSEIGSDVPAQYQPKIPQVQLTLEEMQPGTLADYLGVKSMVPTKPTSGNSLSITSASTISVNALPFIAYHRIYDDWYRNSLIQKSIFRSDGLLSYAGSNYNYNAANVKYVTPNTYFGGVFNKVDGIESNAGGNKVFMDLKKITDLRQRNFGIDRFTSATSSPQNGQAQGLQMTVSSNQAGFTIGQLRAANAIQQWLERNNLAGNRLVDYVKANYGANLSDGVAQRPILLGSGQFAVYSKGIAQTSNNNEGQSSDVTNPFDSVGATYGNAFATGNETIVDSFTAMEPGYLFVMCTLVPRVTYSTGIDRKLIRYTTNSRADMANPLLQGTGNEPIYTTELCADSAFVNLTGSVFGYQERFADWKSKDNELHGLLRDASPQWTGVSQYEGWTHGLLQSFALQSSFDGLNVPQISSNFLEIPTSYLDNVSAVKGDISKYGCWIDSYFDFKVSMPLARYSMPTLQDPAYEHGDDIVLDRGGKRL